MMNAPPSQSPTKLRTRLITNSFFQQNTWFIVVYDPPQVRLWLGSFSVTFLMYRLAQFLPFIMIISRCDLITRKLCILPNDVLIGFLEDDKHLPGVMSINTLCRVSLYLYSLFKKLYDFVMVVVTIQEDHYLLLGYATRRQSFQFQILYFESNAT